VSQVPPVSGSASLIEATARIFDTGGALDRAVPDYEARASQRAMAEAVARTFDEGGILLVEAGTGTGKTLAYLAPAILSGQRVLVSTGTKNLQDQIFFKDLPILRDALGVPFKAAYMKGRANYLCLHRLDAMRDAVETGGPSLPAESAVFLRRAPRPATGPSCRIFPRRCRSGASSRRARNTVSAPNVRATTIASSRGCASRRRSRTWSSSTITCCSPTPRSGRARSEK
jgi:hypothetical protein